METWRVIGCPGSGKTSYLASLTSSLNTGNTLIFSFTRTAVNVIKAKVKPSNVAVSTFHAHAYAEIRKSNNNIALVSGADIADIIKSYNMVMDDIYEYWLLDETYSSFMNSPLYSDVNKQRLMMIADPTEFYHKHLGSKPYPLSVYLRFYADIQELLKHKLDYTRMLELGLNGTYYTDTLIIDEAQDMSPLIAAYIQRFRVERYFIVAGDPDQNIFEFAGSTPSYILNLQADRTIYLDNSHRVPRSVHSLAADIIRENKNRLPYEWTPKAESGAVYTVDTREQMLAAIQDDVNKKKSVLLLAYRNIDARWYESAVVNMRLRYKRLSQNQGGPPETLLAFFRIVNGKHKQVSGYDVHRFLSCLRPQWKKHFADLAAIDYSKIDTLDLSLFRRSVSPILDFIRKGGNPMNVIQDKYSQAYNKWRDYLLEAQDDQVEIGVIHSAKGYEADSVYLIFEHPFLDDEEYLRRIFYVGLTRAKEKVTILRDECTATLLASHSH